MAGKAGKGPRDNFLQRICGIFLRRYFLLSTAFLPKIFRVVFVRMIAAARREKEGVYTQSALSQRSVVVACL